MIADEKPLIAIAASASLALLVAVGVGGCLWLSATQDRFWLAAVLAVAAANVVCAWLLAGGARPGRRFIVHSASAHACWAVAALAAAIPIVAHGLQSAHLLGVRGAWLAVFCLGALGALLERRACMSGLPFADIGLAFTRRPPNPPLQQTGRRSRR